MESVNGLAIGEFGHRHTASVTFEGEEIGHITWTGSPDAKRYYGYVGSVSATKCVARGASTANEAANEILLAFSTTKI